MTLKQQYLSQKKEKEKLYSESCSNCGGKGYNTVLEFATSHADFPGDKTHTWRLPIKRNCRYCKKGTND